MKKTLLLIMTIMLIFSLFSAAEATSGNKPLFLDISTPEDGASDIAIDQEIKLVFSKNVVNISVKDINMTCFSLEDSAGNNVPIEIVMGDDQIHPDQKRDIMIKALEDLKENMTYTVKISPDMMAKNGNTLGEEVTLSFSTISTESGSSSISTPTIALVAVLISLYVVLINKRKSQ